MSSFYKKIVFSLLVCCCLSFGKSNQPRDIDVTTFVKEYINDFYPNQKINQLIFVSIKHQQLYLIRHGHIISKYDISSSKYGLGSKLHSKRTPLGLHKIKHKIGRGVPIRGIIKGGNYTGEKVPVLLGDQKFDGDAVTTRYLHLTGVEEGKNLGGKVDTYERRIYIHGTPEEGLIGKPSSHGCIRMKNFDVWELFDLVEENLHVLILNV